ncbi:TIGR03560 family F420-dependent LLM class oxidoreductase [Micromonospora sp. WMMC241]|uniref:TIGR03560 family F420-dependent LLM class oxidoreductase n=1 Tax=Micromonospora sp. WMMC241 TaxID=3015159 RepID=UPI0022B63685|nr:TIGR03560 family F420-dependent LLM class oxidoreductase [Micromonospora sp. WMMC241]MCZ7436080.1 TIGR03560 family F420-dependent LLM class oxidoreductase [Micromonospora sp. WMMC241]
MTIRWGVVLPQGWRSDLTHLTDPVAAFEAMVAVAREADELGCHSVWLYDHVQAVSGEPETTFECWTSLAAIARETRRVRLGQIVTCNGFRNPALLAKMAATLDVASAGRAFLGLGAGWDQREYDAYGFPQPYPSTGERLTRLDEAAAVVTAMLRRPVSTVEGRHHGVREAQNVPTGATASPVPLLVGGSGEKRTLRTVARYADACNLTDHTDPAFYRHKLDVLAGHCADLGRDPATILKTASFSVFTGATDAEVTARLAGRDRAATAAGSAVGTPAELVDVFGRLVEAGMEYFILYFHEPTDLAPMRLFAREVAPHLG